MGDHMKYTRYGCAPHHFMAPVSYVYRYFEVCKMQVPTDRAQDVHFATLTIIRNILVTVVLHTIVLREYMYTIR